MKHAIYELEDQLSSALDKFCWSAEAGDSVAAARAAEAADSYAEALDVLKAFSYLKDFQPSQST